MQLGCPILMVCRENKGQIFSTNNFSKNDGITEKKNKNKKLKTSYKSGSRKVPKFIFTLKLICNIKNAVDVSKVIIAYHI